MKRVFEVLDQFSASSRREPLNSHRSHQADAIQFPWDAEMLSPHSYASSRFQLGAKGSRLTQPLCSSRITGLHRSYGLVRPRACHRYSRLMAFATCTSPLSERLPSAASARFRIKALVPVVLHRAKGAP